MAEPEHFWTEPLGDRYRFDEASYTTIELRHILKSSDYETIWLEWEQQSIDSNPCSVRFIVSDGVNPNVTVGPFTTNNLAWQDSTLLIGDISGLNNVVLTVIMEAVGNGRARGIVGLLTE